MRLSTHFDSKEFACKCCGQLPAKGIASKLVEGLELLRGLVSSHLGRDTPLVILSGYRCPKHNQAVGGAKESQHMMGTAADVRVPEGMTTEILASLAEHVDVFRVGGIGRYHKQRFVHVDVRPDRARWEG
jgi:uncharacterized protein YcbK (DUF882 family)